ncbi:MAG TPA: hypothetical protein ENL35_04880 [Chloroflexi bacterium]|nr:hypothetical protein [Chloroflexota bacterium]
MTYLLMAMVAICIALLATQTLSDVREELQKQSSRERYAIAAEFEPGGMEISLKPTPTPTPGPPPPTPTYDITEGE